MKIDVNHEYYEVNGVRLHVARKGKGKKLVILLHGWPEFWYTWRYQIEILSDDYTVVAPDLRGFNESDKPKGIENYKTDIVAKDIAELIPALGFKKAFIVGHDWGGAVAWAVAALYPEMTEKLAILNCPHPKEMVKAFKTNPRQILRSWYFLTTHQIPFLPEWFLGRNLPWLFKTWVRGWMYNKEHMSDEDIAAFVEAFSKEGALTGGINYYRAAIQTKPNVRVFKNKIQCPVLIIWGEGDKALGKELTYNTQKYVEGPVHIEYIPKCSHWVQNDCPHEVNTFLQKFLAG